MTTRCTSRRAHGLQRCTLDAGHADTMHKRRNLYWDHTYEAEPMGACENCGAELHITGAHYCSKTCASNDVPDAAEVARLRDCKRVLAASVMVTAATPEWLSEREAALAAFPKPFKPLLDDDAIAHGKPISHVHIKDRRLMLVDGFDCLASVLQGEGHSVAVDRIREIIEAERKHANRETR